MLDYISVPHVFIMLLYHFGMIYGTNLLTRCPVPVPVFCCLFVSEKLFGEVSRNQLEIYVNYFHEETRTEPGGRRQGAPQGPDAPRRGAHLGRAWAPPGALRHRLELPLRL